MSISFRTKYYDGFPLPENFYSKEEQKELSQAISSLMLTYNKSSCLSELNLKKKGNDAICEFDYSSGLLNLKTSQNNFLLDMVNTKFLFTILLPYLQNLGEDSSKNLLQLKGRLESISGYKEAEKVSQIYFSSLRKYIDSYEGNKATPNLNPIKKFSEHLLCSEGLKSFRYLKLPFLLFTSPTIGDISTLPDKQKCRFTKFVEKLPQSLLSLEGKKSKKWIETFLQAGLDCRVSYEDKCLFLRQVIFFRLFKEFLFSMISYKISTETSHSQLEFLRFSLSKFSFSDLLIMIPLSCRFPTPVDFTKEISLFVSQEFIDRGVEKANVAYERLIRVFSQSCNFNLEELGVGSSASSTDQEEVNKFIRGISSLAISGGPFARYSFYQHCLQSGEDLSENIPLEIILATTEHSFKNTSIEESHLGYFLKMLGIFPSYELNEIQLAIHKIGDFIQKIPVQEFLNLNAMGESFLHEKTLGEFTKYYLKGQEQLQKTFSFFEQKKPQTTSCQIS